MHQLQLNASKRCKGKCKEVKPLESFTKKFVMPDGYTNICTECIRVIARERIAARRKENEFMNQFIPV